MSWRRIRDNVCLLQPATIEKISHLVVAEGHCLAPQAAKRVRVDSFVLETNIHWPTESTLICDGLRKLIPWCVCLARALGVGGWRQAAHLFDQVKRRSHRIVRIAARKGPRYQERLKQEYRQLLKRSGKLTRRVQQLLDAAAAGPLASSEPVEQIRVFLQRTEQVRDTAWRPKRSRRRCTGALRGSVIRVSNRPSERCKPAMVWSARATAANWALPDTWPWASWAAIFIPWENC